MKPAAGPALHLRSSSATAPSCLNLLRFLDLVQDPSWDQAFWAGVVIGLCLGFLAALSTEWLVELFAGKDEGQKEGRRVRLSLGRERRSEAASWPGPRELQAWFAECSEQEAWSFLAGVARGPRGHLLTEAARHDPRSPSKTDAMSVSSQGSRAKLGEPDLGTQLLAGERAAKVLGGWREPSQRARGEAPLVQFSQFMHYIVEGEDRARLEVIRIGPLDRCTEVRYATEDATAVAGESYHEASGTLVFEPGERSKTIEVFVHDNGYWDATLEFKVLLSLQGLVNAKICHNMWHARVKVIDTGAFPTNKFKDMLKADRADDVPKFELLFEYIKYNLCNVKVRRGSVKLIIVEQCHNLYFFLRLVLMVYMVDTILSPQTGQPFGSVHERLVGLVIVSLVYVAPLFLLHYIDYQALALGVRGASKTTMQKAIVTKFLNYGTDSRTQLRPGIVPMAINVDAEDLVDKGFFPVIELTAAVGDIITMLSFQFMVPIVFGRPLNHGVVVALFALPLMELVIFIKRKERTTEKLEEKHGKFEALTKCAHETVEHLDLILGYGRVPAATDVFSGLVAAKNKCDAETAQLLLNNRYMGVWLLTFVVALYFFFGGKEVLEGELHLGMLLANVSAFQSIGASCRKITGVLDSLEMAVPALVRITSLLNLPDDLPRRNQLFQKTSRDTEQLLEGLTQITIDDLPIRVADVQYKYCGKGGVTSMWEPVNLQGVMQIQQGTLVSLIGKRRQGKSTLLKLLGGELLLEDESIAGACAQVFIPAHLRVIHVKGDPVFFEGTLMENLTYGVSHNKLIEGSHTGSKDKPKSIFKQASKVGTGRDAWMGRSLQMDNGASCERVLKICQMLGLSEDIMKYVQSKETHNWKEVLSSTDAFLLSLARAFIANPQVLCIHKPTVKFDEISSQRILELMRRFVMEKGLVQDLEGDQRPRTCIYTAAKIAGVEISDQVFHVSRARGIQLVEKGRVTVEMLG